MGGGLQWRPLVHLSDVANAFIKVIQSDSQAVNQEIFNIGLDNFQIKNLAYLVREELPLPIEIDIAPDDADKRDYNVLFEKAAQKIGFKAQVNVNQGIKEIYSALKYGKVDVGPKTITVQWYRNILDSKKLLDEVMQNDRVI
jgi:nucleoside-diphosphate-sugar epimerase